MLSAGGPGTGTCWTAMHKSPTEPPQNAQWRMVTALRLCAASDAGPRSTCALRKGNDGDMCEQSLATHPCKPFCGKYGRARTRPHRAVQCTLRRLIEQAGGYADMERHVPELCDRVQKNNEAAPVTRCAILDVVSWFPGVLQQLWKDVSVRCPHAERYNESASKPGVAAEAGETEKCFDGDHRKLVEPRRRPTTRKPGTCNPGVEANSPDLFGYHVSGGLRGFGRRVQSRTGSRWTKTTRRSWQTSRRRMLQVGRRLKQRCNTPITPPPKKTRTAAPADASQSGASPRRPKGCQHEL